MAAAKLKASRREIGGGTRRARHAVLRSASDMCVRARRRLGSIGDCGAVGGVTVVDTRKLALQPRPKHLPNPECRVASRQSGGWPASEGCVVFVVASCK